jgi:hypothetical protein
MTLWTANRTQSLCLRTRAHLHTTEVVFGPSAHAGPGPGPGASVRDLIAVEQTVEQIELLSEITTTISPDPLRTAAPCDPRKLS